MTERLVIALKPGNAGGAKGPAFRHASEAEEDQAIDMSLATPEKIRTLPSSGISIATAALPSSRLCRRGSCGTGDRRVW